MRSEHPWILRTQLRAHPSAAWRARPSRCPRDSVTMALAVLAPLLQIRPMLRERSSRELSLGYFTILLIGFLLWISYGAVAGILALVIPNAVALLADAAVIVVAVRLRRTAENSSQPAGQRAQRRLG